MRVGVDLDNVVYDFVRAFCESEDIEYKPATCWEFYEERGYTLHGFLEAYETGVDKGAIFKHGEPLPGSLDALDSLMSSGHSIHIVTDRFVGTRAMQSTAEWLHEYGVPYDSLTFSKDKTIVVMDAFIDDKPSHVDALRDLGCSAYMLDRGRSDQIGHPWAVADWDDFLSRISGE